MAGSYVRALPTPIPSPRCASPQGCHCLLSCSHCLVHPSVFLLPGRLFSSGHQATLSGPFKRCSELISILLIPENALPMLLCAVPSSASLTFTFTLSVHTGKRKLNSNGVFCFPAAWNGSSRPGLWVGAQYFPWWGRHWLSTRLCDVVGCQALPDATESILLLWQRLMFTFTSQWDFIF